MTVLKKTPSRAERWGERLLGRLLPEISADACEVFWEDCSCSCHTICQHHCQYCNGRIFCGSCQYNCRYTQGCSSC